MTRELSSSYTWMYRWVIPGLLTIVAFAAIWVFAGVGTEAPVSGTEVVLGVGIAAAAMILARILDRAKRVWLVNDELLISDYRREIRVGLADVAEVKSMPWFWPTRIAICFKQATGFGVRIVFFPPLKIGAPAGVARQLEAELGVTDQNV